MDDAASLYRNAPEARQAEAAACGLITDTFGVVGKRFSEAPRTETAITTCADALADMLGAYLDKLGSALAY